MGQKDIAEKMLIWNNDVFADIVNVLLFGGKKVVRADELEDASPYGFYEDNTKLHELRRDVCKFWKEDGEIICLFGIENQTATDENMPLRVIGYDGVDYQRQVRQDKDRRGLKKKTSRQIKTDEDKPYYPVMTLALNYDFDEKYNNRTLEDVVYVHPALKELFQNYSALEFDIPVLPEETIEKFESDFKLVADYIAQVKNGDSKYVPCDHKIVHMVDFVRLMEEIDKSIRWSDFIDMAKEGESGMYSLLDRTIDAAVAEGEAKGRMEGRMEGIQSFIKGCSSIGITGEKVVAALADAFSISMEDAQMYYEQYALRVS